MHKWAQNVELSNKRKNKNRSPVSIIIAELNDLIITNDQEVANIWNGTLSNVDCVTIIVTNSL